MKVVVISDTHGKHKKIDIKKYLDCDTLIYAGDWTAGTRNQDIENVNFLEWLCSLHFKNIVLIAGNHELYVEEVGSKQFKETVAICKNTFRFDGDIHYLENESVVIDGIKFYGSPYSNEFCGWAFMEYEPKLKKVWDNIDEDTDVLITHGPAYQCHDLVNNTHSLDPFVGSESLRIRKQELVKNKLKYHISGHIHEQSFKENDIDGVRNICSSVIDERYSFLDRRLITFEI
jgi:Icc-related predicted phosphoesterase